MPEDEFEGWVRPHLAALDRFAARLVDPAHVDDVVQESLLRAWRRWETFDPARGSPAGWLLAIVADRARRHRTRMVVTWPLTEADGGARAEHYADIDLERAVLALSSRQRQAVDLYYFVGVDVATCAEAMGCAEGTVRATLHQARSRLRTLLADPADADSPGGLRSD